MITKEIYSKLIHSWISEDNPFNSTAEIIEWIAKLNSEIVVNIEPIGIEKLDKWKYCEKQGKIIHDSGGFFSVEGLRVHSDKDCYEQPVINQNEIGYLGIIAKEYDGKMFFLMQAKIEPGNVNKIQISPTIQATKSNFTQVHKGKKPAYIDYFINASNHTIIVDQLQSEQSSRFLKKRNRNILIFVEDEVELTKNHKWMTLKQIKELLKIDNLVNMDTRTVLSCLPFNQYNNTHSEEFIKEMEALVDNKALFKSIVSTDNNENSIQSLLNRMNNIKMFENPSYSIKPLHMLDDWNFESTGMTSDKYKNFSVIFCDVEIEGREVRRWTQPLFKADGKALFGFFVKIEDSKMYFLSKLKKEIGCFDTVEIGPTVQLESSEIASIEMLDSIETLFLDKVNRGKNILYNVVLSEEGGRFYHEQNENLIVMLDDNIELGENYFWLTYGQLNHLIQSNNYVNIQARNLLSLLEV